MFDAKTGNPVSGKTSDSLQRLTEENSPQTVESPSSTSDSLGQTSPTLNHSLVSVISATCRICHQPNCLSEPLVSPCRCKGSLAYVHLSCLEHWLNQSCRNQCELCHHRFNAVETRRYRCLQSLRIWMHQPGNGRHARSNVMIVLLLTIITIGLLGVSLLGMRYFIIEGRKIGISRVWTRGAIMLFLIVVILGYCITLYQLGKEQIVPWYTWWRNTVNVRLVTDTVEQHSGNQSRESFVDHR